MLFALLWIAGELSFLNDTLAGMYDCEDGQETEAAVRTGLRAPGHGHGHGHDGGHAREPSLLQGQRPRV